MGDEPSSTVGGSAEVFGLSWPGSVGGVDRSRWVICDVDTKQLCDLDLLHHGAVDVMIVNDHLCSHLGVERYDVVLSVSVLDKQLNYIQINKHRKRTLLDNIQSHFSS